MATETIDKLTLICETCNSIVDHPDSPEHDKTFALEIQAWADDCKPLLEACIAAVEPLSEGEDCGLSTETYNQVFAAIAGSEEPTP